MESNITHLPKTVKGQAAHPRYRNLFPIELSEQERIKRELDIEWAAKFYKVLTKQITGAEAQAIRKELATPRTPQEIEALMVRADVNQRLIIERNATIEKLNAENERLKLTIAKLRQEIFGASSEKGERLEDQLKALAEQLESATQVSATADDVPPQIISATPIERKKPSRKPLPGHLPREVVEYPCPPVCECCGGTHLVKLGADVTEMLEIMRRSWKVLHHLRHKMACRGCGHINQAPAPFHPTPRGRFGANLLAMIIFEKFGQHQPLNRQSERYAREGIDLSVSTLVDQIGACQKTLTPIFELMKSHVFEAERLHGDDTTVPVLAKGKTTTGRAWVYVRDDQPFSGQAPPAAIFYYSPDRKGEHPQSHLTHYGGILQADAYGGYGQLYETGRILEAGCWAHARRKFYELAKVAHAPLAVEAVRRIDALMAIEKEINGASAEQRWSVRHERSAPLVAALEAWMLDHRSKLPRYSDTAKAMDYLLKRWPSFVRFLEDGRICMTNNAAERALRGIALGRKSWLFAGSDVGGERAAFMYSLIVTAKLNGVDPQAWLADVLARIAGHPAKRLHELLPWNWKAAQQALAA